MTDRIITFPRLRGTLVATLPTALGRATFLRSQDGRLVCHTESGVPFICNLYPPNRPVPHNAGEGEV